MSIPTPPPGEVSIKAALIHAGLLDAAKGGRGKPSKEMQTQADMLVRDHGYRIVGRKVAAKSTTATPAKVERVAAVTGKVIMDTIPQTRGEDLIAMVNGERWPIGIKGVCNACGVSLTHCPCIHPRVWHKGVEVTPTFKASIK